jgi:hypothetical protein
MTPEPEFTTTSAPTHLPGHNKTCPNSGRVSIPVAGSGENVTMASQNLYHHGWLYYTYDALYDNTCLEMMLYTTLANASALVVCTEDYCPRAGGECPMGAAVDVDSRGKAVVFYKSDVGKGPATLAIYTHSTPIGAVLMFDGIWQSQCGGPGASPLPAPGKKSRGVSSGLAAFLFFFGLGVGIAAMFGLTYFKKKKTQAGFVAM